MEKVKRSVRIFVFVLVILICMSFSKCQGAFYQANKNTQYKKTNSPTVWISELRKMEQNGGALGLNENVKTNLEASTESNNIDAHMIKSTEYGAMAILSASSYGNSSNDRAITTTSGNYTGVIVNTAYWETVAGGLQGLTFSGVNGKYYNSYLSLNTSSAKIGDALTGTSGWHSATAQEWMNSSTAGYYGGTYYYLVRGKGGIFAYRPGEPYGIAGTNYSRRNPSQYSRGVVVCGQGI